MSVSHLESKILANKELLSQKIVQLSKRARDYGSLANKEYGDSLSSNAFKDDNFDDDDFRDDPFSNKFYNSQPPPFPDY